MKNTKLGFGVVELDASGSTKGKVGVKGETCLDGWEAVGGGSIVRELSEIAPDGCMISLFDTVLGCYKFVQL